MGESVRFFTGLRVDEPDMVATQTLLHRAFEELFGALVGTSGATHGGIVSGFLPGNSAINPAPYPINAVPFGTGWLLDAARKFTLHDGVTGTCDMTAIAGTNNSKCWARRAAAQLDTTVEDRIVIDAGAEVQDSVATRSTHVVEFTATTGAAPVGDGWVEILKILTWTTILGVQVPNTYTQVAMWRNTRTLITLLDAIIAEIVEIKGGSITVDTWQNAPILSIQDLSDTQTAHAGILLGLAITKLDATHADEDIAENVGQGLHVKHAAMLLSNGSTLAIVAGRGRNVASIARTDVGKYTITLDVNGNPAGGTMAFVQFIPNNMVHSVDIFAGAPYDADPPKCAWTYEAGSTTMKLRVRRAGADTDLDNNEAILVWVI